MEAIEEPAEAVAATNDEVAVGEAESNPAMEAVASVAV
jgi:hypothetical protein